MADEYISREAALKYIKSKQCRTCSDIGLCGNCAVLVAVKLLEKVPAADVVPVVHGRWIDGAEDFTCGNHNAECSICRCYVSWDGCDEDFNYCPNCGARMDGGAEGE